MNRFSLLLLALLDLGFAARAAAQQVPFDARDLFVSGPTTLLHAGIHGEVKEIWSGFDRESKRRSPLFVELLGRGEIERNAAWLDLTTLRYRSAGTRPGFIRLQSEDRLVSLEITSRKDSPASPLFLIYSFTKPVHFRYRVRWKTPQSVRLLRSDDAAGCNEFSVRWRNQNTQPTTVEGANLVFATFPQGVTEPDRENGLVRRIDSAREIVVCIDATADRNRSDGSYVVAWKNRLGGYREDATKRARCRVQLSTDNPRLDRMFSDSIDAIGACQFANGVVMGDVFHYRDAWMRDGAYSILGLALTGNFAAADAFFGYWASLPGPFAWVGGEREAQQGGIALVAIWYFSRLRSDGDRFLEKHWPYVSRIASYFQKRADAEGLLNLTEEWICFVPTKATWPNAEVYGGLMAGAKIAARLGHHDQAKSWKRAALGLKERLASTGYDQQLNRFIPLAGPVDAVYRDPQHPAIKSWNGPLRDGRVDSGMLMLARLEVFGKGLGAVAVDDPRFTATQAAIAKDLETPEHSIARFGAWPTSPHSPRGESNQWPIVQGWAAQIEWLRGRTDRAWTYLLPVYQRNGYDRAVWNDYLPESWAPNGSPNDPMIAWSHGEFLTSVMLVTLGLDLEPEGADLGLAPSLPPQVIHARIDNFRFRDWRLDFDMRRTSNGQIAVKLKPCFLGSGRASLQLVLPGQNRLLLESGAEQSFVTVPKQ